LDDGEAASKHERWAHLRFLVIGKLLLHPPPKGKLLEALRALSEQAWPHPETGEPTTFSVSTLQRWFRAARGKANATSVLRRKVRKDLGIQHSLNEAAQRELREQYADYPNWSVDLHCKTLLAAARKRPELEPVPSYWTVRRFLEAHGLFKRPRLSSRRSEGVERAEERLAKREVRSWEVEYPNQLWHWDGHAGNLKVLAPCGDYVTPILIGIIDDYSRLACHLQWYYGSERAHIVAHTLMQACMKRGLPVGGYHDNGKAMRAAEITQGMMRLSIVDAHTMVASPYQNGKCEKLWQSVDGQLLAQLQNVRHLTLDQLNDATQAWVERYYNREKHSETEQAPLERFLSRRAVGKESPGAEVLRTAFTRAKWHTQRRSDGTVLIRRKRFEVPSAYRHMKKLVLRYAKWDLTYVHMADEHTGEVICRLFPQDKVANARGVRRPLEPLAVRGSKPLAINPHVPALLAELLQQQASLGLPPPYLPLSDDSIDDDED
jgi:putative transposase